MVSGSALSAQKSVSSVIAQGFVNGSCNNLYMSATIGQTLSGTSQCGPYSVLIGFQQPVESVTTAVYQQVFKNLKVFPNPTVEKLSLLGSLATQGNTVQLKIIDLLGKVILNKKISNFDNFYELDVHTLHPGMYSLVITKSDTELQTILFIKQ
jgi:hypothetical protein